MREPDDGSTVREVAVQPANASTGHRLLVMHEQTWSAHALPDLGIVTIGRGDDADIQITGQGVSRHHARLEILARGFRLTDLGSRNGTRVRQHTVRDETTEVAPGEAIGIGQTQLVIQQAIARAEAPDAEATTRRVPSRSPAMQRIESVIDRVAGSLANVLVLGETGVGKDVLAEALHDRSPRAGAPFLRINCATLSATLLESELFGHERGAFTGARQSKPGLLEMANGGTVFLDEIGELPLEMQAKLLLVLEERSVRRVGAVRGTQIDVRFIAATNRDLSAEIQSGRFRADLFYRLDGFRMAVPALRERLEDLETLVAHFVRQACAQQHRAPPMVEPDAFDALRRQPWPGNLRELRNVIERTLVLHDGPAITAGDLWTHETPIAAAPADDERTRITDALARCGGNQSRAARLLGISRNTLIARIREYRLVRPQSP